MPTWPCVRRAREAYQARLVETIDLTAPPRRRAALLAVTVPLAIAAYRRRTEG